jgi:hypothetical protein
MSINEEINKLYIESDSNIKSVMLGYKYVGGIKTEDICIVFNVEQKRPISEIKPEDVIPSSIEIDGKKYPTDVVEDKSNVEALTCYDLLGIVSPEGDFWYEPEILKLRGIPSLLVPIKGGQEIIKFPTNWTTQGDGVFSVVKGTLGFMAIDNEDNRVVGVTNAHVACSLFYYNSQRIPVDGVDRDKRILSTNESLYNLYEEKVWSVNGLKYIPGLLVSNNQNPPPPGGLPSATNLFRLGMSIKRYSPMARPARSWETPNSILNYSDVAIMSMNESYLNNDSHMVHQPTGTTPVSHMPFATTFEIDNLLESNPRVYSTGRTTGPKGWGNSSSCRLRIDGISVAISVGFNQPIPGGGQFSWFDSVDFGDLIRYRYEDNSNFPSAGGDSGSALLAEIGGQMKIIGLAFAGNGGLLFNPNPGTHYGYACRIDRVAQEMNIRSWDSSYTLSPSGPTSVSVYVKPISQGGMDEKTIVIGGKTYYNIGLTNSESFPEVPS